MKNYCWWIKTLVVICILFGCRLPPSTAAVNIDVEMRLNDGGFISYDHFQADLYLNNLDRMVSDASIFGILEIMGEFFFWPSFSREVDFELMDIEPGETVVSFLAFDFGDIEDFIPFGPMVFWGAWFLDMETWNYDSQEFWLGPEHKWTPTPTPGPARVVSDLVYITDGIYWRGSPHEEPCRKDDELNNQVELSRPFYMMRTEVTRQMWADVKSYYPTMPSDPSAVTRSPTMDHPVQNVTWNEAVLFANLLSACEGYSLCYYTDPYFEEPVTVNNYLSNRITCNFNANGYRLPTEAEWEHACRAGTTSPFECSEHHYDIDNCNSCTERALPTLEQYCVYCANNPNGTEVVGSKLPNSLGLHDMHGNVFEWCWDWYGSYPTDLVTDPTGAKAGSGRVTRGGSWNDYAKSCRSGNRSKDRPDQRRNNQGFRLVRTSTKFVYISAGSYLRGSPDDEPCRQDDETQHLVTIDIGLNMMRTEVTRRMWADVKRKWAGFLDDPSDTLVSPTIDHPVQNISWREAILFANYLSDLHGFKKCYHKNAEFTEHVLLHNYDSGPIFCNFSANGYRLPTEAEWEYACRAGTTGPFSCDEPNYRMDNCVSCKSNIHPTLENHCVYCANTTNKAEVVGSKQPNPLGLRDMHGSMSEWCWDWYDSYPSDPVTNPTGPEIGSKRVIRGGSWNDYAESCRSAKRDSDPPQGRSNQRGFRLVRRAERMIYIPPGSYMQGSPKDEPCRGNDETLHQVTLNGGFYLMRTEVTRQMWENLKSSQTTLPADPSITEFSPQMNYPVQNVTWYEAVLFANLLSVQEEFIPCYYMDMEFKVPIDKTNYLSGSIYCNFVANGYRLPTEAEWEYACRARVVGPFSCTEHNYKDSNCFSCVEGTLPILEDYSVYCANASDRPEIAGSKRPNPWGLCDMHGNVSEWCWDWYGSYSSGPVTDPTGPETGANRVERGGAWDMDARVCRAANRDKCTPDNRSVRRGFRLMRSALRCVYIPAGTYTRGSPADEYCRNADEVQHQVMLTRSFYMMQTEVTGRIKHDLDESYVSTNCPSIAFSKMALLALLANKMSLRDGYTQCYYKDANLRQPVDGRGYNWANGLVFCDFDANGYRLPTEAEWEYACRAGTTGPFSCDEPNYNANNCRTCAEGVHPILEEHCVYCANSGGKVGIVGSKLPNPWGLYDMHGNAWELCWDWYAPYPSGPVTDPTGPTTGKKRVARGGTYKYEANLCRSAHREAMEDPYAGFRLVRTAIH